VSQAVAYLFRDPGDPSGHQMVAPVRDGWEEKVEYNPYYLTAICPCGTEMEYYEEQFGTTEYEPRCLKSSVGYTDNRKAPGA
jgi:hypothetical protein